MSITSTVIAYLYKAKEITFVKDHWCNNSKILILMGYYNMIYQYNENEFIKKCQKSKVDGLIVVDLPFPENKTFAKKCKNKSIYFIQLLAIKCILFDISV